MRITFKLSLLGLVLISGLTLLACGASSPTSPSEDATLVGSVNATPAASSSSVHSTSAASAGGITVSVVGTNLSTTTDSSGQFVLAGVPAGTVTVRFQGHRVDATLEISGLLAGKTLTIRVRVSGSTATLDGPPSTTPAASPSPTQQQCPAIGGKAEVEGTIAAKAANSITVFQEGEVKGNYLCQVSDATKIRKGNTTFTRSQLQLGWRVHVSGTGMGMSAGMCQVKADEIKVQ